MELKSHTHFQNPLWFLTQFLIKKKKKVYIEELSTKYYRDDSLETKFSKVSRKYLVFQNKMQPPTNY